MIKLIISGCNGKMGSVISNLVKNDENIEVVAGFDINTTSENGYPVFSDPSQFSGEADVIIDFSHPACLEGVLEYATRTKTAVVVATTGLSEEQKDLMEKASLETAIFFSANMSIGINLLIELVTQAAKVLEENFDIEIIEKHHNQKIDAPSGTALAIADAINDVLLKKKEYIYDRHSVRKKRANTELGIHTLRGGTIVGEHEVIFAGNNELIELKHTATSREVFAVGAVAAAKFLYKKPVGFYSMKDLVNE
ncbi:MAG: 4-hydroxy-tetrahydrodipicolinate reductase [Clostridia bacterium]|nr:4-hydroxy-tetrahydrodipicolinate reductase [Clostridia bacterium]